MDSQVKLMTHSNASTPDLHGDVQGFLPRSPLRVLFFSSKFIFSNSNSITTNNEKQQFFKYRSVQRKKC